MSEELNDEIEAINSIYGEQTLIPSPDTTNPSSTAPSSSSPTYILNLPNQASSLILAFPPTYPATSPPDVVATHHASGGKRGAGARDLRLFRDAVTTVWAEGLVCVFDAVEEFGRLLEGVVEEEEEAKKQDGAEDEGNGEEEEQEEVVDLNSLPAPPWTISEPWVELKSTFVAHIAPVTSPEQAKLYLNQLLASDKRIANATHNISAWRIRSSSSAAAGVSYQDCDDDGETAAGGRLLHLMQLMDVWDAMVVVTRWYGGVHMGPRRFAVINGVAREGFVKAGLVSEEKKDGKKKGK